MNGNLLANRDAVDRSKTDFYPTPANVTKALMEYLNLPISTRIWEPACGEGHMCKALFDLGYTNLIASDLHDMGYGVAGYDYLTAELPECNWIITNPPFKLFEEFVRRSIEHGKPFALLAKSQCWHAECRGAKLFQEFPPKAVLPLTWRPDFHFGKKGGSPTMECIWTVWDNTPSNLTVCLPLIKPKEADNGR